MGNSPLTVVENIHKRIERERLAVAPKHRQGTRVVGNWAIIKDFRDYARGRAMKTLNSDQIRILQNVLGHDFCDNILRKILWEHANRLRIARFDVDDDDVLFFLHDFWVKNQLPDLFADAVFATLRDGNHGLSLDWIPDDRSEFGGRVQISRERWWDGTEGLFMMKGDDGRDAYAVKEWTPLEKGAKTRRTIYFDDRILRFVKASGGWAPYSLPGDEAVQIAPGVIPWVKRDGSPLGIPVIHLANGSDDDSPYGSSLLDGGALAFQDQINAIQHDITAASLMNGSPQTWSKGWDLEEDAEGNPVKIKTGPGYHHHVASPNAEFGTIEPGDLTQLRNAYLLKIEPLCRNTNTPLHVITGEWPSGEALFRAEMPLVNDTIKLGESLGPSMSSLCHRATEIVNTFGTVELDEDALISTVFEPADKRDPITIWTVAEKAAQHVSKREVLRLAGYTPDQIEQIMDELETEKSEAVSMAQAAFSRPPDLDALMRASGQALNTGEPATDDQRTA